MTRRTAIHTLTGAALTGLSAAQTPSPSAGSGRWILEYFYDRDQETFAINDLCFGSRRFGMAVGFSLLNSGNSKPMALVTRDGGAKWAPEPLPDAGVSAFFLNDSLGWLVGSKGIYRTQEGGREWKKLKGIKDINRVSFRDENHGWAIGKRKMLLETKDGGKSWKPVEEAAKPATDPDHTSYNWIQWADAKRAVVVGSSTPPRFEESDKPAWLDPQKAVTRREWPATTIALETFDGGATWRSQTASTFGVTTRFRTTGDGLGLVLVRFLQTFDYPSELYLTKANPSHSTRIFREKNRTVTDVIWWTPSKVLISAIEPPGRVAQLPIPGKLHMLYTTNLTDWTEMKVDYRAFGSQAYLAMVDEQNIWVATDTGQILRLATDAA